MIDCFKYDDIRGRKYKPHKRERREDKMIKVIMHGCNGRMGQVISKMILEDAQATIVAGIDPFDDGHNTYPVFSSMKECTVDGDVVVDFSNMKAVDGLLDECIKKSMPVVLCTTGLTKEQLEKVEAASKQIPVLRAANMSLGINLLMDLVKRAATILYDEGFDIEIVEKHHRHKLDAPSGTAIALADSINEVMKEQLKYNFDRSNERRERSDDEIGFSAVRGGSIVGEHDIIFAGLDEVVTLSHTAYSRDIFAKGAVAAAKFLYNKQAGMYSMSDVIAEKGKN